MSNKTNFLAMIILSIETSCDETAAAVLKGEDAGFELLSNIVSSQVKLHAEWGGVVPNLAAREHLKNILPIIEKAMDAANVAREDIGLIAVTNGPGLIPALLIGVGAAKTLSYLWQKPLIGIHHIEGHIYANFVSDKNGAISNFQFPISKQIQNSKLKIKNSPVTFPVLCLVVSGGHTQLVLMKKHLDYEIVGQTLDDAAGEAFDKVARILGLGYPGGPAIAAAAANYKQNPNFKSQISKEISTDNYQVLDAPLPRPMLNSKDLNFSFSGLKTAVLYLVKKNESLLKDENFIAEVAAEFQQAACDVLIAKTISAAKKYGAKTVMLAGGVSANRKLREQLGAAIEKELRDVRYMMPAMKYTGDNAAMIGAAAHFRWRNISEKNKKIASDNWKTIEADANLQLKNAHIQIG
ncbi:MAG: tRNA (adenosine(37)-N6)-threonylcarbamoyltransferase complex transferase subunit TsaD [Parcubacteria group bacterium]